LIVIGPNDPVSLLRAGTETEAVTGRGLAKLERSFEDIWSDSSGSRPKSFSRRAMGESAPDDDEDREIAYYEDLYPNRHDYENEDGTEGLNEGGDRTITYARNEKEAEEDFENILSAMRAEENVAEDRKRGVVDVDSTDPQYSIDFNSMGTYAEEDGRREKEEQEQPYARLGRVFSNSVELHF